MAHTAWKVSKYGVFSVPYFPVFGLNTEIYFVNLRIQSEYRKIRTRSNFVFGHFSRSVIYTHILKVRLKLSMVFLCNWWSILKVFLHLHCVKSVPIRSSSGPFFPAFGLNTEIYRVNLRIQSKLKKMRNRKSPNKDTFHAVLWILHFIQPDLKL